MTTRKKIIAVIAACLTGGLILFAVFTSWNKMSDPRSTPVDETLGKFQVSPPMDGLSHKVPANVTTDSSMDVLSSLPDREAFISWAMESLKNDLGETIRSKRTQASLLKLRMFLAEKYPGKWRELFREIVQNAFPEKARDIFEFIAGKDRYNQWFEENKQYLATLDYADIKGALTAKQDELFGEDAEAIRDALVNDVLGILSEAYDTSIDKKLSLYTQMIQDNDVNPTVPVLDESKFYMSRAFFRMDSVQENLKNLSEGEREQTIRSVRQALGYSDEDIEKLAQIDAKREDAWQTGYQYMEDRTALTQSYLGDELDQQLYDLQERYFGKNAQTIQAEEASGFFRFQRPRIYGSN